MASSNINRLGQEFGIPKIIQRDIDNTVSKSLTNCFEALDGIANCTGSTLSFLPTYIDPAAAQRLIKSHLVGKGRLL